MIALSYFPISMLLHPQQTKGPAMHAQPQPRSTRKPRQRARLSDVAALLPRLVLHYNRWTGLESQAIAKQFRPMTATEVRAIAVGDEVWMSQDPIHSNGKVYGYARRLITKVERLPNGEFRLHFESGYTTVAPTRSTLPCYAVPRPRSLARLVVETPLCTQVSAY
ncbi:MAG: hypothetical protein Q7R80_01565 [bacterium]|nr:hypothetical protein [bacterium]